MLRRFARFLTVGALALALLLPAGTATAQEPVRSATERGSGFVRHRGPHWVWFGPAGWTAAYGAYGITISGRNGATLDQGFSSILCANGATWANSVTNYFAGKRAGLRGQGFTLLSSSPVSRPPGTGPNYRRQTIQWRRNNVRGQFLFDYDFSTNVNYCHARNLGLYSNRASWTALRPVLLQVNGTLAYSGPGACDPSPSTPC